MCNSNLIERELGQFVCYHWEHSTFAYAGEKSTLREGGSQCSFKPEEVICCHLSCSTHYQKLFDAGLITKEFYDYYSPDSKVPEPCCDDRVRSIIAALTSTQQRLTLSYLAEHRTPEKDESVHEALDSTYRIARHHGIEPNQDSVLANFLQDGEPT